MSARCYIFYIKWIRSWLLRNCTCQSICRCTRPGSWHPWTLCACVCTCVKMCVIACVRVVCVFCACVLVCVFVCVCVCKRLCKMCRSDLSAGRAEDSQIQDFFLKHDGTNKDCFSYCSWRNNVGVLFATLRVQSNILNLMICSCVTYATWLIHTYVTWDVDVWWMTIDSFKCHIYYEGLLQMSHILWEWLLYVTYVTWLIHAFVTCFLSVHVMNDSRVWRSHGHMKDS